MCVGGCAWGLHVFLVMDFSCINSGKLHRSVKYGTKPEPDTAFFWRIEQCLLGHLPTSLKQNNRERNIYFRVFQKTHQYACWKNFDRPPVSLWNWQLGLQPLSLSLRDTKPVSYICWYEVTQGVQVRVEYFHGNAHIYFYECP